MSNNIVTNRKARRDYEVLESFECGIELKGSEVKSLRAARINLDDSFARFEGQEIFLYNAHISHYAQASYLNVDPDRQRKLLLHKRQLQRLSGRMNQKGFTLIPLSMYFNDRGYVKVNLALCKGKKLYDKRDTIRRRETDEQLRRTMKNRRG
ncbi:MAG: SsrA-binding protein SmpB [Candidatus Omnitrophica bacterium]|jgi:SsrA-binding protein|nr:SsrA-binding protein SmpB [Candidatus Omnitrophota bacterium]MDD3274797.1 SsrA-binding protein SmpB [Candidatus Omnitrophota bacterium]MDD5078590.1 SsrA-binding protein SmpB [Candidatus Omnitrophota bacterium]MDD5725346.1 SsrA-binding protein SmpB [Candidatus Omnitrophota bacterium]